jgi:hypothetical protein
MGFDVTFHPVSPADLQRYCFDVASDPELARVRVAEIAASQGKQRDLFDGVLSRLPEFVEEQRQGASQFGSTVAMAAAAVAGYIHPFWYARGCALSFVCDKRPEVARLITPLPELAAGPIAELSDETGGLLSSNYTAGGVVLPEALPKLAELVEEGAFESFDEDCLDSLRRAIAYARERGLGLMEATDLVVPFSGEAYTDTDNLRAHFLKNVDRTELGARAEKKKEKALPKKAAPKAKKKAAPKPKKKAAPKAKKKAAPKPKKKKAAPKKKAVAKKKPAKKKRG